MDSKSARMITDLISSSKKDHFEAVQDVIERTKIYNASFLTTVGSSKKHSRRNSFATSSVRRGSFVGGNGSVGSSIRGSFGMSPVSSPKQNSVAPGVNELPPQSLPQPQTQPQHLPSLQPQSAVIEELPVHGAAVVTLNSEKGQEECKLSMESSKRSASTPKNEENPLQKADTSSTMKEFEDSDEPSHWTDCACSANLYRGTYFDVWAYCIATVIGGQYYGWNSVLNAGFGSFLIGQLLMGVAYIILACSLAEMGSSTAFSGGVYGMSRVVLGFYAGFLMGMFELLEYIFYTSLSVQFLGVFFISNFNLDSNYQPLIWAAFYLSALMFQLTGGAFFWRFNYSIALFSLIILLIYCFGSLPATNFDENASMRLPGTEIADMNNWFVGGMSAFMTSLPQTTSGFAGVEASALLTNLLEQPKRDFSYGIVAGTLTLFVTMFFTLFVACSIGDGSGLTYVMNLSFFMDAGFQTFGISQVTAQWLMFPSQYAMAFGFILPYSRLLYAMAESNLMPSFLNLKGSEDHRPSVLIGSLISFLLCLANFYEPNLNLLNMALLFGFFVYLANLYAFYEMRTNFSSVERTFRSPFGISGAIFAALVFIFGIISTIGFQNNLYTLAYMGGFIVAVSIYYFKFAEKTQTFSENEQKSLLVLHVIIFNIRKRKNMRKGRLNKSNGRGSTGSANSSKPTSFITSIFKSRSFKTLTGVLPEMPVIINSPPPNIIDALSHHIDMKKPIVISGEDNILDKVTLQTAAEGPAPVAAENV